MFVIKKIRGPAVYLPAGQEGVQYECDENQILFS